MNLTASFKTPEKFRQPLTFSDGALLIGRDPQAGLCLDHPQVSRRHARILRQGVGMGLEVEDCGSANGTLVDGISISGREPLLPHQILSIGPFSFHIASGASDKIPPGKPEPGDIFNAFHLKIIDDAVATLALSGGIDGNRSDGTAEGREESTRRQLYRKILELLPPNTDLALVDKLTERAVRQSLGLGPLEDWLADPTVSEIMINGTGQCYLEREGVLSPVQPPFNSETTLRRAIDRILLPIGRRVDESSPYVDGRLPDGSRLNVIIAPLSLSGPVVTIRKFPEEKFTVEDLVGCGTLTEEAAQYLSLSVRNRRNILVAGGTGTGKTTLLNALTSFIPDNERIITIEDAAELSLAQEHVVRLETRPANLEGDGAITTRDLVRNSLRMRPDRIIVGECRGGEALDMLQAMNTGHEGSMTTCHANSPRDALRRVETMALMAGLDLPHGIIREQVANAIHLVVQLTREAGGSRKVSRIVELTGFEVDQILFHPVFELDAGQQHLVSTGLGLPFKNAG